MKRILLALIFVLALAFPAMAFDINKDIKLEGDVSFGYVFSDDFSTEVNGAIPPNVEGSDTGSKWGYFGDIKLIWKNTLRPWVNFYGISGYGVNNEWSVPTQFFSAGLDYLFFHTKYGSAFVRGSYANWQGEVDIDFMGLPVNAKPESDTWMMSVGWKF